jgi:isoleucyl-tRNA synthetase
MNQVVAQVTKAMETTDPFGATLAVEPFVEDLSNWYVRRSRRRYWKSEHDTDKEVAYATLYHILVKLIRLLAAFTPFVTEVMYQNLVRNTYPEAHESVHHTLWPVPDQEAVDDALITQMDLARRVASLGLSARTNAGLKVRQPLSKVLVHVSQGKAELTNELVEIVKDELNIKAFEFVDEADALVSYRVLPNNKLLGPKFGARFPAVRQALAALDADQVAAKVESGENVILTLDDSTEQLTPEEIIAQTEPAEGLAVAADKLVTVGIETEITPELRAEGLARELVRRIQEMRKNADFNIEDRITTYYLAEDDLQNVIKTWRDYIKSETLSTNLISAKAPEGAYTEQHEVDSQVVTLGVKQN